MVSCIIKGRLGNNGFIQMAAYCYALKHGLEYHCPDNTLASDIWPNYFTHLSNPNWNPNLETVYVNDGKHSYTELPFKEEWRCKNIIIGTKDGSTGFFQSYKYLKGYHDEIREAFKLPTTFIPNKIAYHVRRTDFLQLQLKHPVVTENYLSLSMVRLNSRMDVNTLHAYYSDDIDWCKEFTKKLNGINYFVFSENNSPESDFNDIMQCEHIVTSNSTFSVLAAILAPNPNKVVICPEKFFGEGNSHLDTSTLYPHGWIKEKY